MAEVNSTTGSSNSNATADSGGGGAGKAYADYTAFVLVPVFFLLGLLGVVICHVLKRKGYRCTTEAQDDGDDEVFEEEKDPELGGEMNDTFSDNNDTVGQIVHYIMKNEANSAALKAMLTQNSIDSDGPPLTPSSPGTPTPPMTPLSPGASPGAAKHTCNHLHTIGGLDVQKNICSRCNQKKWPLMRKPSQRKTEQRRSHQGEVTVLAVGRFRVTKCEKPIREGRTLLTDPNRSVSTTPTEVELKNRTTTAVQTHNLDKEKR
ncbi:RELT-like protein 1 [Mastacembelus armatus]|uniref:RELT like 1 n=1 Tax=Mastacembelus armatus TaxID=205130 RepID=A0A3Q3KXP6_9TELE|nr:RELT-like protein 1 [Mastacembelus armatus]